MDTPPRYGQLLPRGQGNARSEAAAQRRGRRRHRHQRESPVGESSRVKHGEDVQGLGGRR
jgi:hypothetical protein